MNKPLAITYKPFRAMNINPSKERSFYTQGQQFAAKVLFTAWLLVSFSPEGVLANPKRQPAMVPGDPSLASTPPTPSPEGQLPLESPESDEAGPSNQQSAVDPSSAVVAPSTATQSDLQRLMSQHGVPDNNNLLAALDAAPTQEQCPWLEAAVKWFANQPIETLSPAAIRDYAALAHVQVTPANKQLLKKLLR